LEEEMRFKTLIVVMMVTALLACGMGMAGAAEPVKIRIAWIAAPANLAPILFAKEGIARHLGKSYVLEPIRFGGSPQVITAIAAGELDIALLAYSSFALAIENAKMEDLRAIADDFQGNVPGYFADHYLVLKVSPIKTIDDLKGKVLATNGVGGAIDIALRAALRRRNLEDKRDFVIVEAALPSMKALLAERKVDLIPGVIPFAYDPELARISRPLFTQTDVVGTTQTLLWASRNGFLQKNRAVMVDFMEDVLRARRFYFDPANHQEAVEIVSKFTRQPASFFQDWVFTNKDSYRDPNGFPNLQAMQSNINLQRELGFLKNALDVQKYADLSIVKEAAERLK
jgi:sulfonate transport system substrate-binding protein